MSTPLIEQQIYLLERYSSKEYFSLMRDAFKAMVKTGWAALDEFMRHLPRRYRKLPVHDQPDIVWGGRVLPNLASTDEDLDMAWHKLQAGDFSCLGVVNGVRNDMIAIGRDYSSDWMPEPFRTEYERNSYLVSRLYISITSTANCTWRFRSLYYPTWKEEQEKRNWDHYWGTLPPPKTWPIYRLNPNVQVNSGERVQKTGVYLPAVGPSSPQFLYVAPGVAGEVPEAMIGRPFKGYQATVWTLVERVADEGGPVPGQEPWREDAPANLFQRVDGGQPCPREGYWWSPANKSQGHLFKKGEIMPVITSQEYAECYWLWGGEREEKEE